MLPTDHPLPLTSPPPCPTKPTKRLPPPAFTREMPKRCAVSPEAQHLLDRQVYHVVSRLRLHGRRGGDDQAGSVVAGPPPRESCLVRAAASGNVRLRPGSHEASEGRRGAGGVSSPRRGRHRGRQLDKQGGGGGGGASSLSASHRCWWWMDAAALLRLAGAQSPAVWG